MTFRRFLAPLLGTVILAIAALVVPGVASAHPGHAHPPVSPAASPAASPAIEEAVVAAPSATVGVSLSMTDPSQPAAIIADSAVSAPVSTAMSSTAVSAAADRDPPGAGCAGMCCDNSPCGGCVKMTFGRAVLPTPLLRAWLPASFEARKLSGRLAEGPNKPPRTFI